MWRSIAKRYRACMAIAVEVANLEAVAQLRKAGVRFRSDILQGVGGNQALVEDPSGNPVELFQPLRPEARLA